MYTILLMLFWLLITPFEAQDLPNTHFLNPPAAGSDNFLLEDQSYQLGVVIEVKWITNQTEYSIFLWGQEVQQNNAVGYDSPLYTKSSDDEEEGGFSWNVSTGAFTLGYTNVYFLSLGPTDSVNNGVSASSHYFNITENVVSSQVPATTSTTTGPATESTSASTDTSTSTQTITAATTTPAGSSQSFTISTTPASSTAMSHTFSSSAPHSSALGIMLGLGLGIPLLLLAILFVSFKSYQLGKSNPSMWPWSTRNQRQIPREVPHERAQLQLENYGGVSDSQVTVVGGMIDYYKSELPTRYNLTELPATREISELSSR